MKRNAEKTMQKIMKAALKEFSTRGFSGARVDRIAQQAHVNKRMIYHYYGNKEGLYQAILREQLCQKEAVLEAMPSSLAESLVYWHEQHSKDPVFVRILEWEALEMNKRKVIGEKERTDSMLGSKAAIKAMQDQGLLPADFDHQFLLLTFMGLTVFPMAFPQLTRMVTGLNADDPEFHEAHHEFLRKFGELLTPHEIPAELSSELNCVSKKE